MAYGIRTYVDGVACDYVGKPLNISKYVFVKWFKEGANSVALPPIPYGDSYVISEPVGFNQWFANENQIPTNMRLVIDAGGRQEYWTNWFIKDIKITGSTLTFNAEAYAPFTANSGVLAFDLYITR